MKDLFFEHFKKTPAEIEDIWKEAIFSFDANTLLDLYRYSEETKIEFTKTLNSIKQRTIQTYQSINEFFNNRQSLISSQVKSYDETSRDLNKITQSFSISHQHPHLDKDILKEFTKSLKKVEENLKVPQQD